MSVQARMIEMNDMLAYFTSANCFQILCAFQTPSQTPVSKDVKTQMFWENPRNVYEGPNRMQLEALVKSATSRTRLDTT